ncbi:MAG: hypothetical protein ACI8V2_002795 [Candidatus Latescibacterota bacterium]
MSLASVSFTIVFDACGIEIEGFHIGDASGSDEEGVGDMFCDCEDLAEDFPK